MPAGTSSSSNGSNNNNQPMIPNNKQNNNDGTFVQTDNIKKRLKVTNNPDKSLVSTNYAYVNQKEYSSFPQYIKINDSIVLIVQPHPKIEYGYIGLNKIQRQSAHIPNNADAECEIFHLPTKNFEFGLITFDVDFVAANTVVDPEVDGKRLIQCLKENYTNHVFTDKQKFVCDFEGNLLLVVVKEYDIYGKEEEDGFISYSPMGIIGKNSIIRVNKPKNSIMKLINLPSGGGGSNRPTEIFNAQFTFEQLGIGGLDKELNNIFRRAFASRVYPPDIIKKMNIKHVKGIILYGPPGTGKTLIARQIGKILNCKEPVQIVNGPEILNKYVGQSEENIRKLFIEAEKEYEEKGDDSQLHLIIFDEFDAICKQRGSIRDGTGVGDSVVNQLLSKIDGVNSLNNILLIGMTNRLDMIDEALLRPGRFDVKMEIGLPDEHGRLQILNIHTKAMRENGFLSNDVQLEQVAKVTKNYSGAELADLVKAASSYALNRQIDINNPNKKFDEKAIKVTASDFDQAKNEVKSSFGVDDELESYLSQGLINYGEPFTKLMNTCKSFVQQVEKSGRTNLHSILLEGPVGCGKTTIASHLAVESGFPYVKIISAATMVGYSEASICSKINKVFQDAYKSPFSIIVIDAIERLIQLVHIGPRFSNIILQALLVLITKPPPSGRKLLIVGTTSMLEILSNLEISSVFNVTLRVPTLSNESDFYNIFVSSGFFNLDSDEDKETMKRLLRVVPKDIPIKKLLLVLEMAYSRTDMDEESEDLSENAPQRRITFEKFVQSLKDCGVLTPTISSNGFIHTNEDTDEEDN
ncbi:hypothetical protein ABK040_014186 [Willaertia magna]